MYLDNSAIKNFIKLISSTKMEEFFSPNYHLFYILRKIVALDWISFLKIHVGLGCNRQSYTSKLSRFTCVSSC